MAKKSYKTNWEALKLWANLTIDSIGWMGMSNTEEVKFHKAVAEAVLEKMKELESLN